MESRSGNAVSSGVTYGGVIGACMAAMVTWTNGQDFWWSVVHAFFGWGYLIGWGLNIWK